MAPVTKPPTEARIDLHLHSTASDGVLAPDALIDVVAAAGVTVCALTDHDTTAGLAPAQAAAVRHGIVLIPGIEVSASHAGRTLHVVGLGIRPEAPSMSVLVDTLAAARGERARDIARRLDRRGLPGSDILVDLAAANVVTRTHFARELVRRGLVADPGQAFRRWLGKGAPAYAPAVWPALEEVVAAINAAGGVAVLAHPLRYTLSAGQRRELARAFRAAGGTALEVCVGGQTPAQTEVAVGLCLRAGLEGSVGSDCHDPALPWQRPGRLAKLPEAVAAVWERWPATPAGQSPVDTNRGAASA
jgi:3',5'-nucleoside bisphosphate phosphatase